MGKLVVQHTYVLMLLPLVIVDDNLVEEDNRTIKHNNAYTRNCEMFYWHRILKINVTHTCMLKYLYLKSIPYKTCQRLLW